MWFRQVCDLWWQFLSLVYYRLQIISGWISLTVCVPISAGSSLSTFCATGRIFLHTLTLFISSLLWLAMNGQVYERGSYPVPASVWAFLALLPFPTMASKHHFYVQWALQKIEFSDYCPVIADHCFALGKDNGSSSSSYPSTVADGFCFHIPSRSSISLFEAQNKEVLLPLTLWFEDPALYVKWSKKQVMCYT